MKYENIKSNIYIRIKSKNKYQKKEEIKYVCEEVLYNTLETNDIIPQRLRKKK